VSTIIFPERSTIESVTQGLTLRPPSRVMRPSQLGAMWAGPLSFARSLLRRIERERWQVERVEFALDGRGEGRALYRVRTPGRDVFFHVLAFAVPADEKTDRVAGIKWDAMASLFIGEPTPERLETMRRELPKQKVGRADADTLVWLRGNKSSRSFERVVAALGAGRQPEADALQSTGYLFRTTAFYGNGKFGTMPFAALRRLGILTEPYHAQMLAAWLLREFISDQVDHLAAMRDRNAAKLDPDNRRYIGIGNSAGIALVPFLARHPKLIDSWIRTYEAAIAIMRGRRLDPGGQEWNHLLSLVTRGEAYLKAVPEAENTAFMSPDALIAGLALIADEAKQMADKALEKGGKVPVEDLMKFAASTVEPECTELLHALLLELFPDIVEGLQQFIAVTENDRQVLDLMTVERLRNVLTNRYGWTKEVVPSASGAQYYFWHRSNEAGEPRISVCDDGDWRRLELQMDFPIQAARLRTATDQFPPEMTDAELMFARPDLYSVIRRLKLDRFYDEVRANLVGNDLVAMPLMRFLLAYYGLERFASPTDRAVRGTFLQGAPTADDIRMGKSGTWPLPLAPDGASIAGAPAAGRAPVQRVDDVYDGMQVAEMLKKRRYTLLPLPDEGDVRVSTVELALLAELALRRLGVPPGVAQPGGEMAVLAHILVGAAIDALGKTVVEFASLPETEKRRQVEPGTLRNVAASRWALDLRGASLFVYAPLVVEAVASLSRASSSFIELEIAAARHAFEIAAALTAELALRGVPSLTEVSSGNAASRKWQASNGRASVHLRIHDVGNEPSPIRPGVQMISPDEVREATEHAERQGIVIAADTLRPIVNLANEVLREPDG
jgi:hypothetical protein